MLRRQWNDQHLKMNLGLSWVQVATMIPRIWYVTWKKKSGWVNLTVNEAKAFWLTRTEFLFLNQFGSRNWKFFDRNAFVLFIVRLIQPDSFLCVSLSARNTRFFCISSDAQSWLWTPLRPPCSNGVIKRFRSKRCNLCATLCATCRSFV